MSKDPGLEQGYRDRKRRAQKRGCRMVISRRGGSSAAPAAPGPMPPSSGTSPAVQRLRPFSSGRRVAMS